MSGNRFLLIIAGPNGSGKTTLYNLTDSLQSLPFVNADQIAREQYDVVDEQASRLAQKAAIDQINEYFKNGTSFCFETVFSHESKLELIQKAKANGYVVALWVIYSGDVDENIERVRRRVEEGGHDVPVDKIRSRVPRTLANLKLALLMVDSYTVFETPKGVLEAPNRLVHKPIDGPVTVLANDDEIPAWAKELCSKELEAKRAESVIALERQALKKFMPSNQRTLSRKCRKCSRPLRGVNRRRFGLCSKCAPKIA